MKLHAAPSSMKCSRSWTDVQQDEFCGCSCQHPVSRSCSQVTMRAAGSVPLHPSVLAEDINVESDLIKQRLITFVRPHAGGKCIGGLDQIRKVVTPSVTDEYTRHQSGWIPLLSSAHTFAPRCWLNYELLCCISVHPAASPGVICGEAAKSVIQPPCSSSFRTLLRAADRWSLTQSIVSITAALLLDARESRRLCLSAEHCIEGAKLAPATRARCWSARETCIIRNVAANHGHLEESCELVWQAPQHSASVRIILQLALPTPFHEEV
mmetsp:Transcript_62286/g.148694  ORF Transcript_62286/g.148694 Transcript_62286/m.148694 type:complete len:267 (+) Transcript_62286:2070-2870(+)